MSLRSVSGCVSAKLPVDRVLKLKVVKKCFEAESMQVWLFCFLKTLFMNWTYVTSWTLEDCWCHDFFMVIKSNHHLRGSHTKFLFILILPVRITVPKIMSFSPFVHVKPPHTPPFASLQVQGLGVGGPWLTDWSPCMLWLRGVINFSKRPPRLSTFINEHLHAMDNLTTPLSPPWQRWVKMYVCGGCVCEWETDRQTELERGDGDHAAWWLMEDLINRVSTFTLMMFTQHPYS